MAEASVPDHYEMLQISPRADRETIDRVFRHLAKRFHPDNPDSGGANRFTQLMEAFRGLSDPEQRARYDIRDEQVREAQWRVFEQQSSLSGVTADRQMRSALLSLLYTARRNDSDRPGMGVIEMERLLGCPEEHMKFHLWYLRENGLVQRLENGMLAITAAGVDRVLEHGGPGREGLHLLNAGDGEALRRSP